MNLYFILLFVAFVLPYSAEARGSSNNEEAFMLQGLYGNSESTIYTPQDSKEEIKGTNAAIRIHIPLLQWSYNNLAFTISNQFQQGKLVDPATNLTQSLVESALGAGLSYRFSVLILGAEYQQAKFSQMTVGTSSADRTFNVNMPMYYGGLIYQFGRLGIGVIYSMKEMDLPAKKTQLSTDRPFQETVTSVSISYHFAGSTADFFSSLFTK